MPSRDRSLRRIRTESVKTMPRTPLPVKERPCPDATLQGRSGADEVLVQREEFNLTGKGTLTCGQPAVSTKEIVEFSLASGPE